ncbi:unnamed protein product [Closterium sp. NIES-53]
MNSWASFGYEILPYRAGPDVRPAGRVDPSLLAALAAAARFSASAPNRTLPAGAFPRCPPGWRKDGKSGGGWGRVGGAGEGKGGLSWPRCCRTKAWRIACRSDGVGGKGSTESTESTGNEVDDELGDDGEVQTGGGSGRSTGSTDSEDAAKAALRAAKAAEDEAAVAAAEYVKLLIVRRCRELMIGMATPAHYDWWLLQDLDRAGGKLLGSDGGVDGTGARRLGHSGSASSSSAVAGGGGSSGRSGNTGADGGSSSSSGGGEGAGVGGELEREGEMQCKFRGQVLSPQRLLAVKYRLSRKEMLLAVIRRLEAGL